jgi:methylenetetrahydrofolate--tRNA-(uracil-5-)-methyltransferase
VEGYLESAAMGLIAGLNATLATPIVFPQTTSLGCLTHYVANYEGKDFAPMNANWGMMPVLDGDRIRDKKERGRAMGARGQKDFAEAVAAAGL